VRGLTIILVEGSSERFRAALHIAAAQAALGGTAHIFVSGDAVRIVRAPIQGLDDDQCADAGLPLLGALFDEALAQGVRLTICQTGLHLTNTDARHLDKRFGYGGLVSVLAGLGDDRLVVI
jgi:predicted peroxiredoxin